LSVWSKQSINFDGKEGIVPWSQWKGCSASAKFVGFKKCSINKNNLGGDTMTQKSTGISFGSKIGACFLSTMLVFTLIAILWAPGPSQAASKVYRWRAQHFLPSQMESYKEFVKWTKKVEKASNGRLIIKAFPAGAVVPGAEQWEAVQKGVVEMALSYGGFWVSKTPVAGFSVGIPFTLRDIQDQYVFFQKIGLEDLVRSNYAKQNIHLLRQLPCFSSVMSSKKPITSVADLKGLKVRATGMVGEMLAAAGAAVSYVPGPEIYGALEKGIVDAAVYGPLSTQYEMGFHEITKYVAMPPFASEGDEVIINLDAWKTLPEDLKMLLYLSAAEHGERLAAIYRYESAKALAAYLKKGAKVSYMPESERKKLTMLGWKIVDKYSAKDPDFAKGAIILEDYLKLIGKMK
jgi:TRAP-type mannitol/chloroaromatic compound transport system substrate-binding protein